MGPPEPSSNRPTGSSKPSKPTTGSGTQVLGFGFRRQWRSPYNPNRQEAVKTEAQTGRKLLPTPAWVYVTGVDIILKLHTACTQTHVHLHVHTHLDVRAHGTLLIDMS